MNIPADASFVKELEYVHVVVVLFRNEDGQPELSIWAYKNADDAQKRFERLKEAHESNPEESPLIKTETFMAGIYENFEQSLFSEGRIKGKVN
jgi:hypothetical protein